MLTYKEYCDALNPNKLKLKDMPARTQQHIRAAVNTQSWDSKQECWVDEAVETWRRFWTGNGVVRIDPAGQDQYIKSTNPDPEIKVTKINRRWHARLIHQGVVKDELACECTEDIGLICKEMLRWFDKMGNISLYADKSRHRAYTFRPFKGKIWYRPMLEQEKLKRMKDKQ